MQPELPGWLSNYLRKALLGEIYPQIRKVGARYTNKKELLIRYYLDRKPTEFDEESIEIVAFELSNFANEEEVTSISTECIFHEGTKKNIDRLDAVIYARREYDMEDNPVSLSDNISTRAYLCLLWRRLWTWGK